MGVSKALDDNSDDVDDNDDDDDDNSNDDDDNVDYVQCAMEDM